MKITEFAIEQIAKKVKDVQTGKLWISLFNSYGARDLYDSKGLPEIGKFTGQRPSKSEYIAQRLSDFNNSSKLSKILIKVVELDDTLLNSINNIINPEHYKIVKTEGGYNLVGDINNEDNNRSETEAHFIDIQNQILEALDSAKVSVIVMMAWFTNKVLSTKLVELYAKDIDVKVALYDDGINKRYGVDFAEIPLYKIKATRGGIMHNKFCVIDNQIVITGSYNWSSNAEFKNDENITIIRDNSTASDYSVQFRQLIKECAS